MRIMTLYLVMTCLVLASCGRKGNLYFPEEEKTLQIISAQEN